MTIAVKADDAHDNLEAGTPEQQDTIRRLLQSTNRMDELAEGLSKVGGHLHVDALAVPSTGVLGALDSETCPSSFVEFFYGDAVPNLQGRPNPDVTYQNLCSALMQREELEYERADDATPHRARAVSRFDGPTCASIFGDFLRRMRTLQEVSSSFQRPGFEKDFKVIATDKSEDFLKAYTNDSNQTVQQIIGSGSVPSNIETATHALQYHFLFH